MSNLVSVLVYHRKFGSAPLKAVAAYMADKASDNGAGVFCSKGTIAAETELSRSTVYKALDELVARGLISEVGQRPCKNGFTVVYDMNLSAIFALPEIGRMPEGWALALSETTSTNPSDNRTRTSAAPVRHTDPFETRTRTRTTDGPLPVRQADTNHPYNHPSNQGGGGSACGRETDPTWREQMLKAMGVGPDGIVGPSRFIGTVADMATAAQWEDSLELDRPTIIAVLTETIAGKRDGPPKSFRYFTPAMQRTAAELQAPPLQSTEIEGPRHERPTASDRRQAAADDRHRRIILAAATARSPSGPAF